MPASTADGWPYPTPSDAVSNTDLQIKELAEALQELIQSGRTGVTVTADVTGSVAVNFSPAYPVAPRVCATAENSFYEATVSSVTTTGFTLTVRQINAASSSATIQCHWIAVP